MIKGFKIRIYPTKEQEQLIWQHIGCCRYIWNYMLALQQERYKAGEKHLSGFGMAKLLTDLKINEEYAWLRGVSNASLQIVCKDLEAAYQSFFKEIHGFPKFKSKKKSKQSYPCRQDRFYFKDEKHVHVEKLGKVKYKTGFAFPFGREEKFSNPRISYVCGKWMLSFGMECESQAPELTDKTMGIDLGVKEQAVVAFGEEELHFHNINKSKRVRDLNQKIRHAQRSISRKYEAARKRTGKYTKTNNIVKEEDKLRRLHKRITNIRHNYIHQITHELVFMRPCRVVMEDLNVQGMMKNKHLARAIGEQNFYEFIRQMRYKCEWNGIEFEQADRFYPSSKTCSCCGNVKPDLKLSDRVYICDECGFTADRDFNAALNLSRYVA